MSLTDPIDFDDCISDGICHVNAVTVERPGDIRCTTASHRFRF